MKAGTTSLYRWLESTNLVGVPDLKEPNFFTDEWNRGSTWYNSLFERLPSDVPTGEASVSYSDPAMSSIAAERIQKMTPTVKLVFIARNPVDRMRSHYRHEVQPARQTRPLEVAIADPNKAYLRRSLYGRGLRPYLDRFRRDQMIIVEFDQLISGDGFAQILAHLGLPSVGRPSEAHNTSGTKRRFTPAARWLFEEGWTNRLGHIPRPLRRLGKALGTRVDKAYLATLTESRTAMIPRHILEVLESDASQFETDWNVEFQWSMS
jgi:hypothetical protein